MATAWTRDDLISMARGNLVGVRSEVGEQRALPDWLVSDDSEEISYDIEELLELFHPEDRVKLVELYGKVINAPGERHGLELRSTIAGSPSVVEMTMLNLLSDDLLGRLFIVIQLTDEPVEGDFAQEDLVDQQVTDWMILTVNLSALILSVEGNSERFIGYSHDELLGHVPAQFMVAEDLVAGIRMWQDLTAHPDRSYTSRRRWVRKDGSTVWVEASYAHRTNPPPGEGPIIQVLWDITDKLAAEERLHEREAELRRMAEDFRALADEVPAAVFRCSIDGYVTFHNAAWSRVLDQRSDIARIHDLLNAESRRTLDSTLATLGAATSAERVELELVGNGDDTSWRLGLRALGSGGREAAFIGSLEDVTATAQLRVEARCDPLTGLLNRSAIEAHLDRALVDNGGQTLVVFIDLDHFKVVNDTWGHEAGDAVLIEVARRLDHVAREGDSIGRWGGDELVLVMSTSRERDETHIVERLQQALLDPVAIGGGADWVPSASIGVIRPRPGESADAVVARADAAMFGAKRAKR